MSLLDRRRFPTFPSARSEEECTILLPYGSPTGGVDPLSRQPHCGGVATEESLSLNEYIKRQ